VTLALSTRNITGYEGVRPHGRKFRAVTSRQVAGVKKFVIMGVFATAVEAAYYRATQLA